MNPQEANPQPAVNPAPAQPVAPATPPAAPAPTYHGTGIAEAPAQPATPVAEPVVTPPVADPFAIPQTPPQQPAQPVTPPVGQPTEVSAPQTPAAPQQQPPAQTPPANPADPQTPPTQPGQPAKSGYESYIESVLQSIPDAPPIPDLSTIKSDSPEDVNEWFKTYASTIQENIKVEMQRSEAIKTAESNAWTQALDKYPSMKGNKKILDTVQAIRMAKWNAGIALSPTEAAEELIGSLQGEYKRGITDNQVHSNIEQVQPSAGGSSTVIAPADSVEELRSVQSGGDIALAQILEQRIKNGEM
jgi:hypothetical protein